MPEITWADLLLRIVLAAALGGAIGFERELRERQAGLRTHMLVSVGAALFTIVSAYAWADWEFSTPAGIVFHTGPGDDRETVIDGIRAIADEGERAGVRVALEPIQREFAQFWTMPTSLDEAAWLLEDAGRPDVALVYDVWHLWNQPLEQIERHRDRIAAVHVSDWRAPTRNTNDRVLPGEGSVQFGPILEALRWDGLYDLEIFSDAELPGSLWRDDPRELARRGVEALSSVCA